MSKEEKVAEINTRARELADRMSLQELNNTLDVFAVQEQLARTGKEKMTVAEYGRLNEQISVLYKAIEVKVNQVIK